MTYKTLAKRHKPETAEERAAVRELTDYCGRFPECEKCQRRVASCQLLDDEYESIIERSLQSN